MQDSHERRVSSRIRSSWSLILGSLLLLASPASAAIVEVGYQGVVRGLHASLSAALPPGSAMAVGTPVTINYRFESTTPDADPDPTSGIYANALTGFTMYVGSHVFEHQVGGPQNEIDILRDSMLTIYQPVDSVVATPPLAGFPTLEADVIFLAVQAQPLAGDVLPVSAPDPGNAAWDTSDAALYDDASTLLIDVDLTTKCAGACAPPKAVPLGIALWLALPLLAVGAGSLGGGTSSRGVR